MWCPCSDRKASRESIRQVEKEVKKKYVVIEKEIKKEYGAVKKQSSLRGQTEQQEQQPTSALLPRMSILHRKTMAGWEAPPLGGGKEARVEEASAAS